MERQTRDAFKWSCHGQGCTIDTHGETTWNDNVCCNSAHRYLGSISYVGTWKHGKANTWRFQLVSVLIVSTYDILPRYPCTLLRHMFAFPGCLPMCINGTTLAMVRPFESATRLPSHVSTSLHMKYYLGIYAHYCNTRLPFQVAST